VSASISDLKKGRTEADNKANSAQRVDVLLRAFLAVNSPAFKAAPTAKEITDIKSQLPGGLGEVFAAVFGSSVDYDFFVEIRQHLGSADPGP
jgi:hypothetical protein